LFFKEAYCIVEYNKFRTLSVLKLDLLTSGYVLFI
jgi:hypothetical protein